MAIIEVMTETNKPQSSPPPIAIVAVLVLGAVLTYYMVQCNDTDDDSVSYTANPAPHRTTAPRPAVDETPSAAPGAKPWLLCENMAYFRFENQGMSAGKYMDTVSTAEDCLRSSEPKADVDRYCANVSRGQLSRPCPDGDLFRSERFCKLTRKALRDACEAR